MYSKYREGLEKTLSLERVQDYRKFGLRDILL